MKGKDQITQWAQLLRTAKAQAHHQGPIQAQLLKAQSELGPEIFKAHFEYAPATSKLRSITDKWLSCPPEPGNTSVRFHEHNSNNFQTLFIYLYF